MPDNLTLTTKDVAGALALSVDHFRRNRARLEAEGFPRTLPGLQARWSRAQVHAWIAAGGAASAPRAEHADYIAEHRGYLEQKYAGARA